MTVMNNDLEIQIELEKLQQHLTLKDETWQVLANAGASTIRQLRQHVEAQIYDQHRNGFQRLAGLTRWLSIKKLARLAQTIGAKFAARMVGEMDPYFAVKVAKQLSPDVLSAIAANADPAKIRQIIKALPAELIRDVALQLISERNFIILGRFADALSAPAIREVVNAVKDNDILLKIGYYMENRAQLSNVIRMIDNNRVADIVRAGTEDITLWPKAIWVIDKVEKELQSRLANIMASEEELTLNSLVTVANREELWGPVLRALAVVNPKHYRKIVNLPALRDSAVITNLVDTAVELDLLQEALPLVKAMKSEFQEVVAHTALRKGEEVAEAVLEAAHAAQQFDLVLDLAQHLKDEERNMIARLPISHNRNALEGLMNAATQTGKVDLLLDFAQRLQKDSLQKVVDISLLDGGNLLQSLLDSARTTDGGWKAVATAITAVDAPDVLAQVGRVYKRQPENDQNAFQQAAQATGVWPRLQALI